MCQRLQEGQKARRIKSSGKNLIYAQECITLCTLRKKNK